MVAAPPASAAVRAVAHKDGRVSVGDVTPVAIDARLAEAAESGETVEVILVLRGKMRRAARAGRWRIRLATGGVLTFAADLVLAATRVPRAARR
jgi:hypothetical protein